MMRVPKIIQECFRLLKPGGWMIHLDVYPFHKKEEDPLYDFLKDWEVINNNENFSGALRNMDMNKILEDAGLSEITSLCCPEAHYLMKEKIKLTRVAKGKKPKYLDDGSIDNLLAMIMTLTQEVSVLRDRMDTLEQILESKDIISDNEIDEYVPNDDLEIKRKDRRHSLLERVLLPIKKELE